MDKTANIYIAGHRVLGGSAVVRCSSMRRLSKREQSNFPCAIRNTHSVKLAGSQTFEHQE